MKLGNFKLNVKESGKEEKVKKDKGKNIGPEIVEERHVEMYLTIQRKYDKMTLREYLSIFTKEAKEKIILAAEKIKKKKK